MGVLELPVQKTSVQFLALRDGVFDSSLRLDSQAVPRG